MVNYRYLGVFSAIVLFGACHREAEKPLLLHYDKPAQYFEEALPMGNGTLGAMIYGRTDTDRISLNDITLWTGEPDRGPEHRNPVCQNQAAQQAQHGRAGHPVQAKPQGHPRAAEKIRHMGRDE